MLALFFFSNPTLTSRCTVLHRQSPALATRTLTQYSPRFNFPSLDPRLPASPRQLDFFLHSTSTPDFIVSSPNSSPRVGAQIRSESRGGAQTHPRVASVSQHGKQTQSRGPSHPPSLPSFLTPRGSGEAHGLRRRGEDCPTERASRHRYLELSPTRLCNNFEVSLKTQINSAPLSF